jgi:hypothetical protein
MKEEGYAYKAAGENLAINFTDAKEQQSAWMESKTHRANILNANYREIGVAVVEGKIDGQHSIVTVQLFGTPLYAAADQAKAVVPPPIAQEVKLPEIKGTEVLETVLPSAPEPQFAQTEISQPSVAQADQVAPPIYTVTKQGMLGNARAWFDVVWLAAVALLVFSLVSGPLALFYRAYRLSMLSMKKRQEERKEERVEKEVKEYAAATGVSETHQSKPLYRMV